MKVKLPARDDVVVDMAPMIDLVFAPYLLHGPSVVTELEKVEVNIPESKHAKVAEDKKAHDALDRCR